MMRLIIKDEVIPQVHVSESNPNSYYGIVSPSGDCVGIVISFPSGYFISPLGKTKHCSFSMLVGLRMIFSTSRELLKEALSIGCGVYNFDSNLELFRWAVTTQDRIGGLASTKI